MMKMKCWDCCEDCAHSLQESLDDVSCCECCKNGDFFEEFRDECTLEDLGPNWW